ncbi:MAG TPA: hypothetical protein VIJ64_11945 [Candidatus Lustribacter sp.]
MTEAATSLRGDVDVHLDRDTTPEGLVQAARHRNPEYLHQQRYLTHANGAQALADVVLSTLDPEATARRYEGLTGRKAHADGRGWAIDLLQVARLVFLSPPPSVAAFGFAVADLERTARLLETAKFSLQRTGARVVVPAEEALGVAHHFFEKT